MASTMKLMPHPLDKEFEFLKISIAVSQDGSTSTTRPVPTTRRGGQIVIVSLNRPKKRNAMNVQLWKDIHNAFNQLGKLGDDCRCIILTGEGKAFSSGIDITDPNLFPSNHQQQENTTTTTKDPARLGLAFLSRVYDMQQCFNVLEECPVPIIAAIHGNCIGAGIDLVCCCDIRIANTNSNFSIREVQIGLAADIGTLQRFPKIVGNDSLVRELCYTGRNFNCQVALDMGFISRISTNVLADAYQLAQQIVRNSPVAVVGTKRSLIYSRDHTVLDGLKHVADNNSLALMTNDIPIAVEAAMMKQRPQFEPLLPFSRL